MPTHSLGGGIQTFAEPAQMPFASQTSPEVQREPSLQGVVAASFVYSQAPDVGLHVPEAW